MLNSYMLPHGTRPAARPRVITPARCSRNASQVSSNPTRLAASARSERPPSGTEDEPVEAAEPGDGEAEPAAGTAPAAAAVVPTSATSFTSAAVVTALVTARPI